MQDKPPRKRACRACQRRRKKCDNVFPSCGPCKKWQILCEYSAPVPERGLLGQACRQVRQTATPKAPATEPAELLNGPRAAPVIAHMPDKKTIIELLEIFLTRFRALVPCFHERRLRDAINREHLQSEAPVLVYAIITMAARYHPDESIQRQEQGWHKNAKLSYDLTGHATQPALRILQAAVCLLCYSTMVCDFSTLWTFQAKAWRQASASGYNAIDTTLDIRTAFVTHPTNEAEKEERRRVMWLLFLFDRAGSFPLGWPHAIDRRYFVVNSPMAEASFQADYPLEPSPTPPPPDPFQSLVATYETLGRVVEHTHILQIPTDPETYQREFHALSSTLDASAEDSTSLIVDLQGLAPRVQYQVLWNHVMIHATIIILHHRSVEEWAFISGAQAAEQLHEAHIQHCFDVASAMMQLIRRLEADSWSLLNNPIIVSALYVFERMLIIRWHDTGDSKYQADILYLLGLFSHFATEFPELGQRVSSKIRSDMDLGGDKVRTLRALGSRAGVSGCSTLRN